MKDIRIATVIFHAPLGEVRENLGRMEKWIRLAREEGARMICFPEMNITGYSSNREIASSAQPVPGKITKCLADMAAQYNMVILAGMAENDNKGHLYASHLVVSPDKEIQVYRKLYLAPPEQDVFNPADDISVFEAWGIKFGIQLCYDAHFPELSTQMATMGVEVIFIPHASPRGTPDEKFQSWMRHLPARAYDNSVFVVACNQTGDNGNGLEFPGLSVILSPSGEVIGKDLGGTQGILFADLKKEDLTHVRNHRMRYFFPNRRPELYCHTQS